MRRPLGLALALVLLVGCRSRERGDEERLRKQNQALEDEIVEKDREIQRLETSAKILELQLRLEQERNSPHRPPVPVDVSPPRPTSGPGQRPCNCAKTDPLCDCL